MVLNDTVFNKKVFPHQNYTPALVEELAILNDELWDEVLEIPSSPPTQQTSQPLGTPAQDTAAQTVIQRSNQQPQRNERLGDLVGYQTTAELSHCLHSQVDDSQENDKPSFSKAMKGANFEDWLIAMSDEFSLLQIHSVGRLVEPPPDANILPGMWRLKRKPDEFGRVSKYKARWVAGGNHQIKGIDFDST